MENFNSQLLISCWMYFVNKELSLLFLVYIVGLSSQTWVSLKMCKKVEKVKWEHLK